MITIITIGGEQVARLTDLRRQGKAIIDELKAARSQRESRVVLTTHGEPVAVLQEYDAYQKLLDLLAETQRQLQVVETRERLRRMNEGKMGTVPLQQVIRQHRPAQDRKDV